MNHSRQKLGNPASFNPAVSLGGISIANGEKMSGAANALKSDNESPWKSWYPSITEAREDQKLGQMPHANV